MRGPSPGSDGPGARGPDPDRESGAREILIRRIRPTEWSQLRQVRLAALLESPEAFGSEYAAESGRPDSFWQEKAADGAGSSDAMTWVAEAPDGRWLGITAIHSWEGLLHLLSVWVAPAERRSGIGRRLVAAALDAADRRRPPVAVHLDVNPRLVPAVRLYRSFGFVETGVVRPLRPGSSETRMAMVRPTR